MERLISRQDAAKILGVSDQTISNWADAGVFKVHEICLKGRTHKMYDRNTVEALVDDANAIKNSKERLSEIREAVEREEKEFRFEKFVRGGCNIDMSSFTEIKELATAFIEFSCNRRIIERNKSILSMFVSGHTIREISDKFLLTHFQIRNIIFKSARKLQEVDCFADILEENEKLKLRNSELETSYRCAIDKLKSVEDELSTFKRISCTEDCAGKQIEEIDNKELANIISVLNIRVNDCDLPIRITNVLFRADAKTLADVVCFSKRDLLQFRNMGRKHADMLEDFLESYGLHFGMDVESYYRKYNEMLNENKE